MSENSKMNNDLSPEEMKILWNRLNERVNHIEEQFQFSSQQVVNQKLSSSKEQLASIYKRFFIISSLLAVVQPSLLLTGAFQYPDTVMRYIAACAFGLFFLTAAIMDCNLFNAISDMNLSKMSIAEVSLDAKKLKRRHHIYQLILLPMAIITLTVFCIPLASNEETIYGVIFGGIVGVAVSLRCYLKIMHGYKNLMNG